MEDTLNSPVSLSEGFIDSLLLNESENILNLIVRDPDQYSIILAKLPSIIYTRMEELLENKYDDNEFVEALHRIGTIGDETESPNLRLVGDSIKEAVAAFSDICVFGESEQNFENISTITKAIFSLGKPFPLDDSSDGSSLVSFKQLMRDQSGKLAFYLKPIQFEPFTLTDSMLITEDDSDTLVVFKLVKFLFIYKFVTDLVIAKRLARFYIDTMLNVENEGVIVFSDDLFDSYDISISKSADETDFMALYDENVSLEAATQPTGDKDLDSKKKVEDMEAENEKSFTNKVAAAKLKQRKFSQKVKGLWNKLTGQANYYKKYIGRMDGLLEMYGDEADLKENEMFGDPVKILTGRAQEYIVNLVKNIQKLHDGIINTANKIASAPTVEGQINTAAAYCGINPKDENFQKDPSTAFYRAFMKKLGSTILEGGNFKVYGYTIESIEENYKLPPPNHLIVSLFVKNAHEEPSTKSINSIFDGPESFRIMADVNKIPIYKLIDTSSIAVAKTGDSGEVRMLHTLHMKSIKNNRMMLSGLKGEDKAAAKEKISTSEQLWKGVKKSLEEFLKLKFYIIGCADVYSNMVDRIDRLCKQAISELIFLEKMKKDERHNTGFRGASFARIDKNLQNRNDRKEQSYTLGEKAAINARTADTSKVGGKIANSVINFADKYTPGGEVRVAKKADNISEREEAANNAKAANANLQAAAKDAKKRLAQNWGK